MTENESLKIMLAYKLGRGCKPHYSDEEIEKAFDTAISAIQEIRRYREIGTVEECREAVEKQKPEAPAVDKYHHTCCPSCGWVVAGDTGYGKEYLPHCENCGQKILWDERMEETEDDG